MACPPKPRHRRGVGGAHPQNPALAELRKDGPPSIIQSADFFIRGEKSGLSPDFRSQGSLRLTRERGRHMVLRKDKVEIGNSG